MENVDNIDMTEVYNEVVNKLRAVTQPHDPLERVTLKESIFTGDGTTTKYLLNASTLSFVKNVFVDESIVLYGHDYVVHFSGADKGMVELLVAPSDGDEVKIEWGELAPGMSNYAFDDFPRDDLSDESYPRVGTVITKSTNPGGLGNSIQQIFTNDLLIQVKVIDTNKFVVRAMIKAVEDLIKRSGTKFYTFHYAHPSTLSSYDNFNDNTKTRFTQYIEFIAPTRYEIITQGGIL